MIICIKSLTKLSQVFSQNDSIVIFYSWIKNSIMEEAILQILLEITFAG